MRHPFLRTLAGSAAPAATDPNFKNVVMLLHADGTNGATNGSFVDSSPNNFTITPSIPGTAAFQGSASPYGNFWSNYFAGSGNYLTIPDNAAFDFGTGDFTIECWVFISVNSGTDNNGNRTAALFSGYGTSGVVSNGYTFEIEGNTTTTGTGLSFYNNVGGTQTSVIATTTISQNTWHHVAVSRSGTTTRLFLDGALIGSGTLGNQNVNSDYTINIGRLGYSGFLHELNGYISNLRVLKGTALYTGTYTVPTTPLTAITNTSLLTCQSNRFIDNSANNFTLTSINQVTVYRFNPFSRTQSYSAGTFGGSFFPYGNGEQLLLPANQTPLLMGSSDWSFEAWVYRLDTSDCTLFAWQGFNSASNADRSLQLFASVTQSSVYQGSTAISIASPNPGIAEWAHVAWARTGGTFSSYLNGVRVGTASTLGATAINNGSSAVAPSICSGLSFESIFISGVRIIKGSGGYNATSSTITVPTSPPTAVTNTSLLLNFTNAGLFDNTSFNDGYTTATISTSVKKYGTGSLSFDGGAKHAIFQGSRAAPYNFNSGNFTIEFWLYLNSLGTAKGLIGRGSTNNSGWGIELSASNAVLFRFATTTVITSSVTLTTSTWYHIAVVRTGTGTNQLAMYIDGTNRGTGSLNSIITSSNDLLIGAQRSFGTTSYLNGYLDDIRITNGVARYTSNFTPPTAAFPDLG